MNILFLSTRSPYPLISGHSLRTYHILRGAAERHDVTLVTFIQLEDELKKSNIEHLQNICKAVYTFRIPVDVSKSKLAVSLFLNLFGSLPFVAEKYDVPVVRRKINQIIRTENIDLVHVDMLPLTVYVNEFGPLPKILVNHNVESVRLYRWYQAERKLLKKFYLYLQWLKLRSFERSALTKFGCCVVVSDTDKQILQNMGNNSRFFVVPNGTDTAFFRPTGKPTVENSVIWIGHMDVHTNKDAVLYFWREIYPLLRKKQPEVQTIFVGTSPPKEIALAAKKDAQVKVTGFVHDIRPYLDEAAVMLVPIRIGSGTRLKILDAMAMEKAIVSTSVGAEGLDITPGKNILLADHPEDFTNKTIELLNNRNMRSNLQKEARQLAKTYDWNIIKSKQERVYQYATRGGIS